jgi:membrane fusion protein, copper/silver efflux system
MKRPSRLLLAGLFTVLFVALVLVLAGLGVHLLRPGGLQALLGAQAAQEVYTCPMVEDAEVRSDKPGRCPKCGMDLVPISQTEHKGKKPGSPAEAKPSGAPAPSPPPSKSPSKGAEHRKPMYYCPMHPAYTSDKPGDCPICNMALVPVEEDEGLGMSGESAVEGHIPIVVPPARRQLIGVTTGPVEKKALKAPLRTVGRVTYDEKRLSAVTLKFGAFIEELHVKAAGERVKVGQPLFDVYSPDLLEAQRNYLAALEASREVQAQAKGAAGPISGSDAFERGVRSARERLLLWDLTEDQLREIEAKKEPRTRTSILSKVDGVVTERSAVQGEFIAAGMPVFRLADLSTVWIDAAVYEVDLARIKPGDAAKVTLTSLPGQTFEHTVNFVYPYLDPETRSARARIEVEDAGGRLKPGMYAEVTIEEDLGEHLVVPEGAVLDTGTRQLVFVDRKDGRLEPREIKAGARAAGSIVVLEGLKEGETVVTSGTFLIDSESRIKAARAQGAAGAGGGPAHGAMEGMKGMEGGKKEAAPAAAEPAPSQGHPH